jgi:hypothetical protein
LLEARRFRADSKLPGFFHSLITYFAERGYLKRRPVASLTIGRKAETKTYSIYQGCHDAPLSTGFLELRLTFFRCEGAPFWASYSAKIKFNIDRNNVNIRQKWTLKRFTLPISTLLTKVVSVIREWKNGATLSVDNLEPSLITKYSIFRQVFGNNLEFLEVPECPFVGKVVGPDHL